MQPSEMTNEELAFYIVNTIGGGIFKEYYTEVAARLRKLKIAEERVKPLWLSGITERSIGVMLTRRALTAYDSVLKEKSKKRR